MFWAYEKIEQDFFRQYVLDDKSFFVFKLISISMVKPKSWWYHSHVIAGQPMPAPHTQHLV